MKTDVQRITDLPSPDDAAITKAIRAAVEVGQKQVASVTVVLCDDDEISGVHGEFFDDPTPTDVITFPMEGDGSDEHPIVGELLVSLETAAREAAAHGDATDHETLLYVVHGVLHLCGLDDQTPESRVEMRSAERVALQSIGVSVHTFE